MKGSPKESREQNPGDLVGASWMSVGLQRIPTLSLAANFFWWFSLVLLSDGGQTSFSVGKGTSVARCSVFTIVNRKGCGNVITFNFFCRAGHHNSCYLPKQSKTAFVPQNFETVFHSGIKKRHSVFHASSTIPVRLSFSAVPPPIFLVFFMVFFLIISLVFLWFFAIET